MELLVAMAIFTSVMGGLGLLFVSSTRTVRQAFQNQEAFEAARGTLSIMQRDLNRAFTAREYGDFYNFYGSPIGLSFVGLVSPRKGAAPNLSRVTYVVYHDAELDGAFVSVDDHEQATFSLLRFVEPGVDHLDDFPVSWDFPVNVTAELPGVTLQTLIDDAVAGAQGDNPCSLGDAACNENVAVQAARAKRRELWIRMLSGGDDVVPNAWEPSSQPGMIRLTPLGVSGWEEPIDYVVTENLLFIENIPRALPVIDANDTALGSSSKPFYFQYVEYEVINGVVTPSTRRFWNDVRNMRPTQNNGAMGSPLEPRLPQAISSKFVLFFESSYPGAPDFNRAFDQLIDVPSAFRRLPAF